jgi:hypothetical protein
LKYRLPYSELIMAVKSFIVKGTGQQILKQTDFFKLEASFIRRSFMKQLTSMFISFPKHSKC